MSHIRILNKDDRGRIRIVDQNQPEGRIRVSASSTKLQDIVRLLEGNQTEDGPDKRKVYYNIHRKCVVDRGPGLWSRGVKTYVVTVDKFVKHSARGLKLNVGDGGILETHLECDVMCPDGNERILVGSLAQEGDPAAVLDRLFSDVVHTIQEDRVSDGLQPGIDFFDNRDVWQKRIADDVSSATGLNITVRMFAGQDDLSVINLNDKLSVYVQDCEEDLSLWYEVGMEVRGDRLTEAVVNLERSARLREQISEELRRWIPENYSAHEFCTEQEQIKADCRRVINDVGEAFGRRVGAFRMDLKFGFQLPEPEIVEHSHRCRVQNHRDRVEIRHTILLQLQDVSRWRRSGVTEIAAWVRRTLEEVTQDEMFNVDYVTVVSTFDHVVRPAIRTRLEEEAVAIGFRVKQFSSVANDELKQLQEQGFRLEIDEEFSTQNSRVRVKLNIVARGRIEDLERVEKYVAQGTDLVEEEIKPEIMFVAADVLHETTPEQFYLYFETVPDGSENANSTRQQLSKAISNHLFTKFGARCKVTVKPVDTKLTERFDALLRARGNFNLDVIPTNGTGVHFHISYRIRGVHPKHWHIFQEGGFQIDGKIDVQAEVDDITQFIKDRMSQRVNRTLPANLVHYDSPQGRQQLEDYIFETTEGSPSVIDEVIEHHGLIISISRFERGDAKQDEARRKLTEKQIDHYVNLQQENLDHDIKTLRLLRAKERQFVEDDDMMNADLDVVKEHIEKIEKNGKEKHAELNDEIQPYSIAKTPAPKGALADHFSQSPVERLEIHKEDSAANNDSEFDEGEAPDVQDTNNDGE